MADAIQLTIFANLIAGLQQVLGLDPSRCFEVAKASDVPTIPPGNDWFLTICWGDSSWPAGEQVPGNMTEEPDLTITIYTRLKSDQAGHDMLLSATSRRASFHSATPSSGRWSNTRLCSSARETIKIRHSTSGEVIENAPRWDVHGHDELPFGRKL